MAEVQKSKVLTRGEKARLAAKRRRDKEAKEMSELVEEIPLETEKLERENKCSILQVATSYIEMRNIINKDMVKLNGRNDEVWSSNENQEEQTIVRKKQDSCESVRNQDVNIGCTANKLPAGLFEGNLLLQALDGFLIFINKTGKILFISEQVEDYLGFTQVNLIGRPIKDFIYGKDHDELFNQMVIQSSDECSSPRHPDNEDVNQVLGSSHHRSFYIRMKASFKRPGTTVNKQTTLLTRWLGKLKTKRLKKSRGWKVTGLVAICQPIRTSAILEVRLEGNMFISRHDMGMKFIYCEQRIVRLIGYEPSDLIGRTAYHFHYPLDATKIQNCHSNLILKGCSTSKFYRFLGKTGDWVWMQTRASIVYNSQNQPQYVVCMNYVISPEEGERCLQYEQEQLGIKDPHIQGCIDLPSNHSDQPQGEGEDSVKVACDINIDSVSMDTCLNDDVIKGDDSDGFMDVSFAISSSVSDTVLDDQGTSMVTMATNLDPFLCSSSTTSTSVVESDSENRDSVLQQFSDTMEDMDILDDLLENIKHFPPIDQSPKISTELSACSSMQLETSLQLGFEDHSTIAPASPKDSTNSHENLSKSPNKFTTSELKPLCSETNDLALKTNNLNSQKDLKIVRSFKDSKNPEMIQCVPAYRGDAGSRESVTSNVLELIESQAGIGGEDESEEIESDSDCLHQPEKSLFSWIDNGVQLPGEATWAPQHVQGQRLSPGQIHVQGQRLSPGQIIKDTHVLQDVYESVKPCTDSQIKDKSTQPTTSVSSDSLCPEAFGSLLMSSSNTSSCAKTNLGILPANKDSSPPAKTFDIREEKSSTQSMNSCHTSTDHLLAEEIPPSTSSQELSSSSLASHTEQSRFSSFTSGSLLRSLLYRGKSLDQEINTCASTTIPSSSSSSTSINSYSTTSSPNQTLSSSCSNLENSSLTSPSIVVTPCSSSLIPLHSSSSSSSSTSSLILCPKSLSASSSSMCSNSLSPSPSSTRSTTPVLPASSIPKSSSSQILSSKYYTTSDSLPEDSNSGKTLLSAVLSGAAKLNIPTCKKDLTPGKDIQRSKNNNISKCNSLRPHLGNLNLSRVGRRISNFRGHTCKAGFTSQNVSGLNLSGLVENLSRMSSESVKDKNDLSKARYVSTSLRNTSEKQCILQQNSQDSSYRQCSCHKSQKPSHHHCNNQESQDGSCHHKQSENGSSKHKPTPNSSHNQCSHQATQDVFQKHCSPEEPPNASSKQSRDGNMPSCPLEESPSGSHDQCSRPQSANASDEKYLNEETDSLSDGGLTWNDLPDDLLDVAMQYCESLGDEQTQALMDEFGQDLWSSANDLYNVTRATQDSTNLTSTDDDINSETMTTHCSSSIATATNQNKTVAQFENSTLVSHAPTQYLTTNQQSTVLTNQQPLSRQQAPLSTNQQPLLSSNQKLSVSTNEQPVLSSRQQCKYWRNSTQHTFSSKLTNFNQCSADRTCNSQTNCNVSTRTNKCYKRFQCENCTHCSCHDDVNNSNDFCDGLQSPTVSSTEICKNSKTGENMEVNSSNYDEDNARKTMGGNSSVPEVFVTRQSIGVQTSYLTADSEDNSDSTSIVSKKTNLADMSELEKHLRGYKSNFSHLVSKTPRNEQQVRRSTESPCKECENIARYSKITPFLHQLLTGELSQDIYHQVDKYLLDNERRKRKHPCDD